jgi:hypothetical protein
MTLLLSIGANLVLWLKKENLEQAMRYAEYNDRARASLHSFDSTTRDIDRKETTELQALFEGIDYEGSNDLQRRLDSMDSQWLASVPRQVGELRGKLDSYNAASKRRLDAFRYAAEDVKRLKCPSQKAEDFLRARIGELQQQEDFLNSLSWTIPHPPPGYFDLLQRQAKLEARLREVRLRPTIGTAKATMAAAWPPDGK